MPPGRRVLALLAALFVVLAALAPPAAAAQPPRAAAGWLDLASAPGEPVALAGQWGFAWGRFVDPHWQALPTAAFAPAPASWNDVGTDGKPPGPHGWGSYVLGVNCPAGESLAVEARGQRTASRLFVNGTQVAQHGVPAAGGPGFAAVHNRVPITREFPCPLRLTLHVSNHDHRAGGFVRPMWIGPAAVLERARESRVVYGTVLLTAYLLTGLVGLIIFAVRPRDRVPLAFALFCVAMGVYTDMIGERLLLRPLPAQVSWRAFMMVEYLTWLGAMGLFLVTLRGLFPAEIHRRVVHAVLAAMGLAALAVLALPPAVYSHMVVPGQAVALVVAVYVAAAMVRAHRSGRGDARVLLAGMLVVLAALAVDLLLIDAQGPDRKFASIGFALFLLSPAVVIARRMSQALNAEERARTLEENARLREDVERMSRHDLKTPLNSILGATRLLRDDAGLAAGQRELLGVVQRAALRMLEMVNLSLGLFRMEQGSYDFRPQAVDLREVVTRVLVDLQSYAEANSVTLHLQGTQHEPVYVRAEELLCYSIVANLVKNAVEAAGPGRRVSLALHRGDPVALSVHNPGEVPAAVASRFFEKYATAGKSGGTGLGTYSARLMAQAQQGELAMRTGAVEGTTLTLALRPLKEAPVLPRADAGLAEPPAQEWLASLPARELLLVDDDEYTRLVMRRFLPSPPFAVATAANGQAAMEALARRRPDYLVVDMEMPFKDGLETVRWLREREAADGGARCRVLMWSGNDDEGAAARALAAGADRFLVKPVSREALLSALRELEALAPAAARPGLPPPAPALPDETVVAAEWKALFPDFVRLQRETADAMARALAAGDREDLRFLAHRAFGGLAALGVDGAAAQCRAMEKDALDAPAEELEGRIEALREHLSRLRLAPA